MRGILLAGFIGLCGAGMVSASAAPVAPPLNGQSVAPVAGQPAIQKVFWVCHYGHCWWHHPHWWGWHHAYWHHHHWWHHHHYWY